MNIKRWAPLWILGTCAIFLFVWQQIQSVRLGYQLENTHQLVKAQRAKNAYLRLEVERTLSPSQLARVAQERLHMVPPSPEAVVVLDRSGPSSAPATWAQRAAAQGWTLASLPGSWARGSVAQ